MGNATLGCERCCFVSILIHQADDWESRLFVSRQMCGANDAAGADDNDGTDLLWAGLPDRLNGCGDPRIQTFRGGRIWHVGSPCEVYGRLHGTAALWVIDYGLTTLPRPRTFECVLDDRRSLSAHDC